LIAEAEKEKALSTKNCRIYLKIQIAGFTRKFKLPDLLENSNCRIYLKIQIGDCEQLLTPGLPDGTFSYQKSQNGYTILEGPGMDNVCRFNGHSKKFTAIEYILWPFSNFVVIWYFSSFCFVPR
jgi:hypothetical protein